MFLKKMKLMQLLKSRDQLFEKVLFRQDVGKAPWLPTHMSHAAISTAVQNFAGTSSGNYSDKIFAPYTVFKGKAALSVSPVLPTFRKLSSGGIRVERRGVIMLTFWPAIGERKYDWEKKQAFALSPTEVGSVIILGSKDSCEFFHDPSMLSSNAGQVRKSLSFKSHPDGSGYFVSLCVANTILKTNERFTVPVTAAEFSVMRTAFSFALPHIMGWDRYTNELPTNIEGKSSGVVPQLEWDK